MADNSTSSDKATNEDELQDFAVTFIHHAGGRAHAEASRILTELVGAIRDAESSTATGTLTIKLKLSRQKGTRMINIDDSISCTKPASVRRSIWFPGENNTLHRNDPRQGDLYDDVDD